MSFDIFLVMRSILEVSLLRSIVEVLVYFSWTGVLRPFRTLFGIFKGKSWSSMIFLHKAVCFLFCLILLKFFSFLHKISKNYPWKCILSCWLSCALSLTTPLITWTISWKERYPSITSLSLLFLTIYSKVTCPLWGLPTLLQKIPARSNILLR